MTPAPRCPAPRRWSWATWRPSRGMRQVAEQATKLGRYDAVIHNAGVGYREPHRIQTEDGLSHVFAINVLAPYLLTALMTPPVPAGVPQLRHAPDGQSRLRPTCSGSAVRGTARRLTQTPSCSTWCWRSRWPGAGPACSATRWSRAGWRPGWAARVRRTTCPRPRSPRPGWRSATTPRPPVTGQYFYHQRPRSFHPAASSPAVQDQLLASCAELTGVEMPKEPA